MASKLMIACASFALLAGCNHAGPVHHSDDAAKTQVETVLGNWQKAFEAKDVNGVMAMYAPDVTTFDVIPPLQFVGADSLRKDYAGFFGQFDGPVRLELRDNHVEASGDIAVAYGLERVAGKMKSGTKMDMWMRYTSVFERVGGQWRDVHDHVSVPIDPATGKAAADLKPSA
jgi:ketosteroid isomerase-like protein